MPKIASHYFEKLNWLLKNHHRAIPCLLIDLDKLDSNLERLKASIPNKAVSRIVVKSIPSFELIEYAMKALETTHLMLFHQPFLTDLSARLDEKADILLGKPFPLKAAEFYYAHLPNNPNFNPYTQIQWLVDTPLRLQEYLDLAERLRQKLRLNLEINIGLNRGGFPDLEALKVALQFIQDNQDFIELSGLMGYDPHVAVELPKIARSQKKSLQMANDFYQKSKELIQQEFPDLWKENLTFNGAGSPTIKFHETNSPLNDLSAGSCLVMPTSFDIPTLDSFEPACFIATPVLKRFEGTTLPRLEWAKSLLNVLSSSNRQSFFIYGGLWKADYCYPEGVKQNKLFKSTNQNLVNAPQSVALEVDDFVFLRPTQSEFVFLQFGEILTFRGDTMEGSWSLLKNY